METAHYFAQRDKIFTVAPISDIQYTEAINQVAETHLVRHLEYTERLGAHYVGGGDYIDFMSPSNRARLQAAALYDNSQEAIEHAARSLVDSVYGKYFRGGGPWIGLVTGHHYAQFSTGENSDELFAKYVHAKYLGTCGLITIDFGSEISSCVRIWLHHGTGSGQPGSVLRKLYQMSQHWPEIDIFIMGHQPKVEATYIDRIIEDGDAHKRVYLISSGGWAKSYTLGRCRGSTACGDYAEVGMMPPAAIGAPVIRIEPQWEAGVFSPIIRVEI